MVESQDPAVLRRRLTVELRRARNTKGLSQKEVASELTWSPSKILRIENGSVGVTPVDLRALLDQYGVEDKRYIDELVKIAIASRRLDTTRYRKVVSQELIQFWTLRSAAVRVRQLEMTVVPGLLQVEEYARAVLTANASPDDSEKTIDARVEARMEQTALIERDVPPHFFFVIDESCLRRVVGGPAVMRNQLEHLKKLADLPNVSIQVLTFNLGAHPGVRGPFQFLEFGEGEDYVLHIENARGDITTRDMPEDTDRYIQMFWRLEALATKPREFGAVVDDVIANIDAPPPGQRSALSADTA
jgi:transcriptional regulator with XRE-family HTH domain